MKRIVLIFCIIFFVPRLLFAQDDREIDIINLHQTSETTPQDIPLTVIEKVPVYPGCTGEDNAVLKTCMADQIAKFVIENFTINECLQQPDSGSLRIFARFKIDKEGCITQIKCRASHKTLEKEAIRVIKQLPQMIPGKHKGKEVATSYAFPIIFCIK